MSSESSARDGTSSIIRVSIERRQGTPPLCLHDPAQAVRGEAEVLFVYHLLREVMAGQYHLLSDQRSRTLKISWMMMGRILSGAYLQSMNPPAIDNNPALS